MPNPLNKSDQRFFPDGKPKDGRPPSKRGRKKPDEPSPEEVEPPRKQPRARSASKQLHSDKPYVPPGGTKEIAHLLRSLVGVKKSREKDSGVTSAKK